MPQGRVENTRIARIQREVRGAGVVVNLEHLLPGFATVAGAVDTALRVGRPDLPLHRHPGRIRVAGMYFNLGDLPGLRQSHEAEAAPGIGGFPQTLALAGGHATDRCLAGADINHIRIGGCHGDRPDSPHGNLPVGDVLPAATTVLGFPDASAGGPHVIAQGLVRDTGHRGHAATAPGADQTILQALDQRRIDFRASRGGMRQEAQGHKGPETGGENSGHVCNSETAEGALKLPAVCRPLKVCHSTVHHRARGPPGRPGRRQSLHKGCVCYGGVPARGRHCASGGSSLKLITPSSDTQE